MLKGSHYSEEAKRKMSEANKGHIPSNKGIPMSEEQKIKISKAKSGCKLSKEHRLNMSLSRRGEKNYNWKGGIAILVRFIRKNYKYRQWRSDIFTRDNFTCQICGDKGGRLNAHHIKSFSSILQEYKITTLEEALNCEELWNINNGITYCKECHSELGVNYAH